MPQHDTVVRIGALHQENRNVFLYLWNEKLSKEMDILEMIIQLTL